MEILFLGTGAAWAVPEHSCACAICSRMLAEGEERTRTSFLVRGSESILMDCGPDWRIQMKTHQLGRPDAILITHEHSDHFLGLDDLLAFRRSMPAKASDPDTRCTQPNRHGRLSRYASVTCWDRSLRSDMLFRGNHWKASKLE